MILGFAVCIFPQEFVLLSCVFYIVYCLNRCLLCLSAFQTHVCFSDTCSTIVVV